MAQEISIHQSTPTPGHHVPPVPAPSARDAEPAVRAEQPATPEAVRVNLVVLELRMRALWTQLARTHRRLERTRDQLAARDEVLETRTRERDRARRRATQVRHRYEELLSSRDIDANVTFSWSDAR
jgi:hypothetical protein